MFLEGLPLNVWMLFAAAAFITLIFGFSSGGWTSLGCFGLSLLFTVFCVFTAPTVNFDGVYYYGMFNVQLFLSCLTLIDAAGIIYRLLISGGED